MVAGQVIRKMIHYIGLMVLHLYGTMGCVVGTCLANIIGITGHKMLITLGGFMVKKLNGDYMHILLSDNTVEYHNGTSYHRSAGPARIWPSGEWTWWLCGVPHRYYGMQSSFDSSWSIHGLQVK